jgi:HAMP domain-containing protein
MAASVGGPVIPAIYPACRATVLGMTALKQLVFSLAFAIAAVAAAQYVMWILNGQPVKRLERANRTYRLSSNGAIRRRPGP